MDAALQRHGGREGRARGLGALPRGRSGREEHSRERHIGRADQDLGGVGHRRLPLHPQMERAQCSAAPQRDDRGGRRHRGLFPVRPVARGDRGDPPRRCRLSHRRNEAPGRARHRRRARSEAKVADSLDARHLLRAPRVDRLERATAPARSPRRAAEPGRPRASGSLRRNPARSARPRWPLAARPRLRVEPARSRARDHGIDARDARTGARRLPRRRAACRDFVRRVGRPDLCRRAGARQGRRRPGANPTSGAFCRPAAKATRSSTVRLRAWHETVDTDTVVAAHGGTARALIAHLAIAAPDDATHYSIDQGVVYVFAGNTVARYG